MVKKDVNLKSGSYKTNVTTFRNFASHRTRAVIKNKENGRAKETNEHKVSFCMYSDAYRIINNML